MQFVTYENHKNPHVTIHKDSCGQIAKRSGQHQHGQGEYKTHGTYRKARKCGDRTPLRVIDCSFCLGKKIPPAVRILPMDIRGEFRDYDGAEDVQHGFFLNRLPSRQKGCFRYKKRGLKAEPRTIVLFQCDRRIIASAVLHNVERFTRPDSEGYEGAFHFDVYSIKIFDPIDEDGIKRIWPGFKGFSHVKHSLDPKRYMAFERTLKEVRKPLPYIYLGKKEADSADPAENEDYNPDGVDRRPLVDQQIRARRGQPQFRNALCKRHGDCCLVTGCKILAVLEAAHINPHRGDKDNHPTNGLLLRADIHTLVDLDLLGIEPDRLRVELHPEVAGEYQLMVGKILRCKNTRRPSRKALQERYKLFTKRAQEPV